LTTKTLQAWLTRINQPESWLHPQLSELSDQSLILDRDVVIKRIVKAIQTGESIAVYGDYDLDGTSSAIILTDCIRQCGGRVTTLIASRFDGGGYGFNDVACSKVIALGATLVITADCGSSDHAMASKPSSLIITWFRKWACRNPY
jgi:single-stranded-DNA-specific exonuclease